ncbi:PglD-related sugar-binding protein [Bacteroides pyogenes]|uniref:Sugar O-acyltransferase n=2 Tax=Bacteroides pyogenes TaxID=310300 RepID=A0A5D3E8U9_9BACE|nr:sugar O-acyltransferase [Bacteroides pyogenes]MCI7070639.1 sugar O-acyltransferase [Bacteroides pyogenes]TYK32228.1 sugar O-acyltransferase [Bacteroides pyogenes]TYK50062.1 sugar O-acyltransferase [Bacteroides pyogenes]
MNKPLVIIGGTGHGCVIEACINDNRSRYSDFEWDIKGFCNDYDDEVDGYPVLGKIADIPKLLDDGYYFAWGIHLIGRNLKTASLFESLVIPDDRWATIIHKSAFIDRSVELGPGVFVMYNAYIAPRTKIGKCTMIKANTNIGHDVKIGAISHIAIGATIVSCVEIGYCSDVAVSSTVLAHSRIGDYAMLGADSLLTHEIPNNEIFVGSPARFLKKMLND